MTDSLFSVDGMALAAILAMAVATYATRAGGFFIIQRLKPTPFMERWLDAIPGTMFVALVAPAVLAGGLPAWAGAVVAAVAARAGVPLVVSMVGGVATVAGFRALGWTG